MVEPGDLDIALFKGVKYSGVRSTPLYFTLPYFTQLKNAIEVCLKSPTCKSTEKQVINLETLYTSLRRKSLPGHLVPLPPKCVSV
jgi:hypothetical protein